MEKLFENENGYVYPVENGFRVYWKKEELSRKKRLARAAFLLTFLYFLRSKIIFSMRSSASSMCFKE